MSAVVRCVVYTHGKRCLGEGYRKVQARFGWSGEKYGGQEWYCAEHYEAGAAEWIAASRVAQYNHDVGRHAELSLDDIANLTFRQATAIKSIEVPE